MLTTNGQTKENGDFDWKDAFLDAGIIAGLTFFTSGVSSQFFGDNPIKSLVIAGSAAASQFFLFLAVKRGIKK